MYPFVLFIRKQWFNLAAILLFLAIVGMIGYQFVLGTHTFPVLGQADNFMLINSANNQSVKLTDTDGKVRLLTFIYTRCPTSCPLITHDMSVIQKDLQAKGIMGKDVEFVSITLDPQYDTAPIMQAYAKSYGADTSSWQFLCGNPTDISKVLNEYSIGVDPTSPSLITHSVAEFLIDGNGNIRKEYDEEMDIKQTEKDIQALIPRKI